MIVTKKFSFDLETRGISPLMYAVQGDVNTRKIEISLFSNGTAWEIPDGTVVAVAYRKPDGTGGLYDKLPSGEAASAVSGNVVTVMLAPQVLTCAGNAVASVVFYSQDMADTLATFSFQIHVEKNPAAGEQISNNYYTLQNLEQVNTAYNDLLERVLALEQGGGSGQNVTLTTAQINALDDMFKVCAFIKDDVSAEYNAFKTAFGITDSGGEDEPNEPEKTLTSISAVYSGGDVVEGTAVNDLTGIVVTAHYSDGTSETVTDYTLSGPIADGSNIITVSYGGKTTTFAVTGVAAEVTSLRGVQLPIVPSNFTTNENWQYSGNSGNLCSVIGSVRYLYLGRVFTGTVWIRSMTSTPFTTISMGMALVAEDYITNQTAEGEKMTATQSWDKFDDGYLRVSVDGSEYKFSSDYPTDGLRYVRLSRFDIPEGQYAVLHAANAGTGNGNTFNVDGGWMTVFFEDPTEHITVTEVVE